MLLKRVIAADNINFLCPEEIAGIDYRTDTVAAQEENTVIELSSGRKIHCALLVGADGVNSKVREVAAIQRVKKTYQQQGLVCNVTTSEPHQNTAWQCFMPSGPLAFLPLYKFGFSFVPVFLKK